MRRLALMGADQGPCVSARGIHKPQIKVSALPEGGRVYVVLSNGQTVVAQQNGVHSLGFERLDWVEVRCEAGKGHKTICEIISTRAA